MASSLRKTSLKYSHLSPTPGSFPPHELFCGWISENWHRTREMLHHSTDWTLKLLSSSNNKVKIAFLNHPQWEQLSHEMFTKRSRSQRTNHYLSVQTERGGTAHLLVRFYCCWQKILRFLFLDRPYWQQWVRNHDIHPPTGQLLRGVNRRSDTDLDRVTGGQTGLSSSSTRHTKTLQTSKQWGYLYSLYVHEFVCKLQPLDAMCF